MNGIRRSKPPSNKDDFIFNNLSLFVGYFHQNKTSKPVLGFRIGAHIVVVLWCSHIIITIANVSCDNLSYL